MGEQGLGRHDDLQWRGLVAHRISGPGIRGACGEAARRLLRTGRTRHCPNGLSPTGGPAPSAGLAVQTGLRASELFGLNCADVHLGAGAHVSCTGKGRKQRITPLTSGTVAVLRSWLTERTGLPADPLFPTRTGRALSRDAVERRLAGYVVDATDPCPPLARKRVSMHVLRHSAAMRLLRAGTDTAVIALSLGHEQTETTQIYLHADPHIKERALERTAPIMTKPGRFRPNDKLLAFLEAL